jgi:PAS domain S-box-containing protein
MSDRFLLISVVLLGVVFWLLRRTKPQSIAPATVMPATVTPAATPASVTPATAASTALPGDARFRQIVNGINDYAIFMLDLDGRIITWNNAAEAMTGYTEAEILGQHFSCFYSAEDLAQNKPAHELATVSTTGRFEDEGWRLRKDGSRFWADEVISTLQEAGELRGFVKVTRNITNRKQLEEAQQKTKNELEMRVAERTAELVGANERLRLELDERKRAQEAVRISQARFAGILEIADDAIISVDANQGITLFNQGAEKIFGYTAQEVMGRSLNLLIPGRFVEAHRQHVTDFSKSSGRARRMGERREIYGLHKDGTEFPAEASISKLEIGGEKVFTVILRNIISRKQAEEAMEYLSHQNELILNSVGEGLCGLNLQGNITFVNPAGAKLLGYQVDELIGQSMQMILPCAPDGTLYHLETSPIYSSLSDGTVHHVKQELFRRSDGSSFPVEYVSTPIQEQSEIMGSVITFKDITERQIVERMKDEFVSVVSHELRTPLTSIHGSLGMLASGLLDAEPETGKRLLEIAVDSTDRLVRLINDILDVERIESGKITMEKQACNAADLLAKAIDVMQAMAEKSGVRLLASASSVQLWADPDRIMQTLTNLLSNAIKFSSPGSTVWLKAELQAADDWMKDDVTNHPSAYQPAHRDILFSITDQGRGIPADKLETIFERFQQVDASDSRNHEGTGLGLAICRSIVQQHGGHIWVESALGAGSTFYFTIPIDTDDSH